MDLSGQILFAPKPRPALPLSVVLVAVSTGTRGFERCLRALLRQDIEIEHEIIVADANAEPEVLRITGNWARRSRGGPALRYVSVPQHNAAAARNEGWRDAAGDVVAFTDDPCVPKRSWLRRGHAAFADASALAVAGCVRDGAGQPCPDEPRFSTSNCLVRRRVLEEVGGFNPHFRSGGDHLDLLLAVEQDRGLRQAPRAIVVRDPRARAAVRRPLWRLVEALRPGP